MKTIKPKAKIKPVELTMTVDINTIKPQNEMILDDKDIHNIEVVNVNDSNIEMVKESNFVQEQEQDKLFINGVEILPIPKELPTTIEQMMDNILDKKEENLNPNLVHVSFTLTKRQHALFEKKGGVKWLKKKLVN